MTRTSSEYQKEHYRKHKDKKKQYALDHKESIQAYRKEYYLKNKIEFLKDQKEYYSKPENRAKKILAKCKERATKDNIEFNIDLSDINIPTHCPYLNIELTHELGQGQLPTNSSIDRIDPTRGYVKGNIQIISRLANTMKSNATQEQLKTFATNILKEYGLEGTTLQKYLETILK